MTPSQPLPFSQVDQIYQSWKKKNPQHDLSVNEFSALMDKKHGNNRYSEGTKAGFLQRSVAAADRFATPVGNAAASFIRGDEDGPRRVQGIGANIQEGIARGAEMMGSNVPSILGAMYAMTGTKNARALKTLGGLLPYGYISGYNQTADAKAAAVNSISLGSSPYIAKAAVNAAGRAGAGPIGRAAAGVLGGLPGDIAEVGSSPTGDPSDSMVDRFQKNVPEFFSDPANSVMLLAAEAPFAATDIIASRNEANLQRREEMVKKQRGLLTQGGKAENIRTAMRDEYSMDIPNGVPEPVLRNAFATAQANDVGEAQRKIYGSMGDDLTPEQASRFELLKLAPDERRQAYSDEISKTRDWESPEAYPDEIEFKFDSGAHEKAFYAGNGDPEFALKSRQADGKLFYWGVNKDTRARLSEYARAGKVSKFALARGMHPEFARNPALDILEQSLSPRSRGRGPKVGTNKKQQVSLPAITRELKRDLPKDMYDHYVSEGLLELGAPTRQELDSFITRATPEIEVKKLIDVLGADSLSELGHLLETLGIELRSLEDGSLVPYEAGTESPLSRSQMTDRQNQAVDDMQDLQRRTGPSGPVDDMATGRYGVDPIDVADMDRPVDILVRSKGDEKYRHNHFGDSDKNVIGSVRGYFTSPDTFFAFEIQSDWAQAGRKRGFKGTSSETELPPGFTTKKSSDGSVNKTIILNKQGNQVSAWYKYTGKGAPTKSEAYGKAWKTHNMVAIEGDPNLARYERLALQAAMRHAKENGATKFVLPDAETVMMFEGHESSGTKFFENASDFYGTDLQLPHGVYTIHDIVPKRGINKVTSPGHVIVKTHNKGADRNVSGEHVLTLRAYLLRDQKRIMEGLGKVKTGLPTQYKGMQTHYGANGTLRSIAEKLGAKYVGKQDLGDMDSSKAPVTDGRNQSNVFQENAPGRNPSGMKQSITGFEFDISAVKPDEFRLYAKRKTQAADERNLLNDEILTKLDRIMLRNARQGQKISTVDYVNEIKSLVKAGRSGSDFDVETIMRALIGIAGENKILSIFKDGTGIGGYNLRGLTNPDSGTIGINLADQTVLSAITTAGHELSHSSVFDYQAKNPEGYARLVDEIIAYNPTEFAALVTEANKVFGLDLDVNYATGNTFDQNANDWKENVAHERIAAIAEIVVGSSFKSSPKANKFLELLPIEAQRFIRQLVGKLTSWFAGENRLGTLMSEESRNTFNDIYSKLDQKVFQSEKSADFLAKVFQRTEAFNPTTLGTDQIKALYQGKTMHKPTKDFVEELTFSDREELTWAQKHLMSGLSLSKIYPVAGRLFERLHNYRGDIQKTMMGYFSEIGQNAEATRPPEEAMDFFEKWTHGVAMNDTRLSRIGDAFEEQQTRRKNPNDMDKPSVLTRDELLNDFKLTEEDADMVQKLNSLVKRVAFQEFLDMSHKHYLNQAGFLLTNFAPKLGKDDAEIIGRAITQIATEGAKTRAQLEQKAFGENTADVANAQLMANFQKRELVGRLTQELTAKGVDLNEADARVKAAVDLASLHADYRIKHMRQVEIEGYAPQTRRGDYILRYRDANGEEMVKGFKTMKAANARWKVLAAEGATNPRDSKKSANKDHYRHYSSQTIQGIRNQGKGELNRIVGELAAKEGVSKEVKDVLAEISEGFGDLDAELSDALGQKADPFKLKRNDVGGFEKQDFLPNLIDYINIKTIIGQKGIIAARAKLEMAQPEFYNNKDLMKQFQDITEYTLNSKQNEWSLPRKFVYNYFLGFSMRHYLQNITQPFIVGMPELAAQTGSMMDAPVRILRAYGQIRDWNRKGTTGDPTMDRQLKQAEDEGVWNPSMLKHYLPTDDLNIGAMESVSYLRGAAGFGKKAKISANMASRKFQDALKITAESSEILNRQVAFASRINGGELDGDLTNQQLEQAFADASRFTNDVNFVGDKSNRPGFIRNSGNAHGPVLFATSLMSFVINHLSLLGSYKTQVFKGSTDWKTYKKNPDKFKFDNPGAYGLMMAAVMMTAFAGALGMPFAQDADEVFEEFTGIRLSDAVRSKIIDIGELFSLSEENGDMLADAAMSGLPTTAGIGLGNSVGLGRIFSYQTGRPFTFWDLLGAAGSTIQRTNKGISAVAEDPTNPENWERAFRKSAPSGLLYWQELSNLVQENKQVDSEGRIVSGDLDAGANLSRLLGFTPSEVSQGRSTEFKVQRELKRINDERISVATQIGRLLSESSKTGNTEQNERAKDLYRKFIVKEKLSVAQRTSLIRSISTDIMRRTGQAIPIPNDRLSKLLAEAQESNPDYSPQVYSALQARVGQVRTAVALGDPIARKLASPSRAMLKRNAAYEGLLKMGAGPSLAKAFAASQGDSVGKLMSQPAPKLQSF